MDLARNEAAAAELSDMLIKPKLEKHKLTDLKKWQEIVEQGRQATMAALPELPDKLISLHRLAI